MGIVRVGPGPGAHGERVPDCPLRVKQWHGLWPGRQVLRQGERDRQARRPARARVPGGMDAPRCLVMRCRPHRVAIPARAVLNLGAPLKRPVAPRMIGGQ